jgi:hypothetical protein
MSQRKTLSKVPLTPQFTTIGLSYADVVKCDMSNHVHVWDHSYSTSIQSVEENCTHDHSYVKNTPVTKIPVIDHSKGNHSYPDVDLELCPTKDTRTRQTHSESVQ